MTEDALLDLARKGDEDAFAQLMTAHQGKVYGLTLRLTGSPDDALELSQEVFFNAWRGLPNFHGESRFSTWLYRLATNAAIDFLRKEKRRRAMVAEPLDGDDEGPGRLDVPDHRFDPQSEVERKEFREAVRRGLGRLTPEHRTVLVLRELSGLSYKEIGDILHVEEGTVKSRLARARLALRKVLLSDGNFSPPKSSV